MCPVANVTTVWITSWHYPVQRMIYNQVKSEIKSWTTFQSCGIYQHGGIHQQEGRHCINMDLSVTKELTRYGVAHQFLLTSASEMKKTHQALTSGMLKAAKLSRTPNWSAVLTRNTTFKTFFCLSGLLSRRLKSSGSVSTYLQTCSPTCLS